MARAHPGGRALPAHVRPLGVLHRRGARRRRARADDARGARRGHARVPVHADRRRGAPRGVPRPHLLRGRRPRGRRPQGPPRGDLPAPQPRVRRAVRRDAQAAGGSPGGRAEDLETLVEAVTIYHMVVEGMLALTGQHFIMDYNERVGTLPAFVQGFTLVARDEHRHVAFGARFLRDMARRDPRFLTAIQRTLTEVAPVADGVLKPAWMEGGDDEMTLFGVTVAETRAFAMKALERRMKVIGLLQAA